MAEDHREKHLAGFLKSMPLTDGSCQGTLDEWLERAELVVEFVPGMDIVTFKRFLVKTATGSLLQDICNYHDDVGTPNTLLEGLRASLVDASEVDRRVHEADSYTQSPYQTVTDFISHYRYRYRSGHA